jgi:hypothetical protein
MVITYNFSVSHCLKQESIKLKTVTTFDDQSKNSSSIGSFLLLLIICTGCPPQSNCLKGELKFEPPSFASGTVNRTQGSFYNNGTGLYALLIDLSYSPGVTEFKHASIVSTPPHPFGTSQVLRLNNSALSFDLTVATQNVKFEYLYEGGIINLGAKGNTNIYIGPLGDMPAPLIINGVTIWKTNVHDILNPQGVWTAQTGEINLKHPADIGGLIIGGTELFLDNFCTN